MRRDTAGPSLLLDRHDIAQREHIHHHHHHHAFHPKRQLVTATAVESVITEVVATVSVIAQIGVDSLGSSFTTQTLLAYPTTDSVESTTAPATADGSASSSAAAVPVPVPTTPASSETVVPSATPPTTSPSTPYPPSPPEVPVGTTSTPLPPSPPPIDLPAVQQSLLSTYESAYAPTTSTPSTPTTFASLIISSNTTTLISSSSSIAIPNFSNSSIASTNSSASATSIASSSSSSGSSTSTDSLSSSTFTTSYEGTPIPTGGVIGGGSRATSSASAASSTAAGGGGGSQNSSTSTPVVVGGVVGSIAGAAIIIFLLMVLIRWKKRHQSMLSLGSGNEGAGAGATPGDDVRPPQPPGGMAQRRSIPFGVQDTLASLAIFKRSSQKTDLTASTEGSERGFYRVSGRKLPSVFQHGGDGYGDPAIADNTLGESSFYRDSQGFYGGQGSPSSPVGMSFQRDSGIPVIRPSPARTPTTEHAPFPPQGPPPVIPLPRRPDLLGRSHPSLDGSHASRFTEEV